MGDPEGRLDPAGSERARPVRNGGGPFWCRAAGVAEAGRPGLGNRAGGDDPG
jgi:hypothetical protein